MNEKISDERLEILHDTFHDWAIGSSLEDVYEEAMVAIDELLALRSLNKRLVEDGERLADRLDAVKNMMVGKPPLKLAWTTGIEPVLDQHAALMKEIGG